MEASISFVWHPHGHGWLAISLHFKVKASKNVFGHSIP